MLKISSLFEAYITNLGKYNEGRLVGETLKFPATTEEVQALLKRIGVDGVRYEEIFITSFDGDVLGLYDHLGEYESIDELNHLAHVLSDLDQSDIEKFEALIDSGEYTGSVHDLINLAQNLDCYDFYPGIDSEEALGRVYIEEMEMLDVPDNVLPYFDFEAYGRDARINDGGHFARQLCGAVSRDGGYSPGAPYLRLSQAEYPGADVGVSGGHRPFGAERGKAAAPRQPRGQIGRFWSRWPEGKGGVSYRRR